MSILFLILKIIGILILIPIVLLLILLIFPICYQIEGDFDGKSPKAQVKVSWAVIFLRAKAFYEEEKGKKKRKKKDKKKPTSKKKSKKETNHKIRIFLPGMKKNWDHQPHDLRIPDL